MSNTFYIEKSLKIKAGVLSPDGALMVKTGASTGRSTKERFLVQDPSLADTVDWGDVNQGISVEKGQEFFAAISKYLANNETDTMSGYVGCFPVQVTSTSPWHIAFARNMFRQEQVKSLQEQVNSDIEFSIYHAPYATTSELGFAHPYEKAIVLDIKNRRVGIVGTAYAGEIKKSAFTMCNYFFPEFGVMPMHASANCLSDGEQSSILFGLSGTGKTTLSADPNRCLIGDDEIVWSKGGLSNLEGGCYAKLIDLCQNKEPDIFKAANRFGSILENVQFNDNTREIDFTDNTITENTRGSYDLSALNCVFEQSVEAKPPKSIIFLTADAFGALPAVARLNSWQAQYHFISGYTAKVAGTEIGVTEPKATFSSCFGAPFMPRSPRVYAELLAKLQQEHNVSVWLLNTGWVKGYSRGERFPIPVSRQLLTVIQSGELDQQPMRQHETFGFEVPTQVPGVDAQWLQIPEGPQVQELAERFQANAKKLGAAIAQEVVDKGGPRTLN